MNPLATESWAGSVVMAPWSVVMRGIFLRISMMAGEFVVCNGRERSLKGRWSLGWCLPIFSKSERRGAKDMPAKRRRLTRSATEVLAQMNLDILTPIEICGRQGVCSDAKGFVVVMCRIFSGANPASCVFGAGANPSAGREKSDFALNAESNGYTETANRNPKKRGNGTY